MRAFDALRPDPDKVGGVEESPFVRLPDPNTLFADRARRFATLAEGSVLGPYLRFLSGIARAQAGCVGELPTDMRRDDAGFLAALDGLLGHLRFDDAPEAAVEARDRLVASSGPERLALAEDVIAAAYPADRVGECLYVAAAVQVWLTRVAAGIDARMLQPGADGVCPACGGAPVASLVVGWTQASKARYLCCGLCGTQWNYVRIKCSACGSTEGISYYHLEGDDDTPFHRSRHTPAQASWPGLSGPPPHAGASTGGPDKPGHDGRAKPGHDGRAKPGHDGRAKPGHGGRAKPGHDEWHKPGRDEAKGGDVTAPPATIAAEACSTCRSYLKHLHQHTDPSIEPLADDIASYGLDLLVRAQEFRPAGVNPLFVTAAGVN